MGKLVTEQKLIQTVFNLFKQKNPIQVLLNLPYDIYLLHVNKM